MRRKQKIILLTLFVATVVVTSSAIISRKPEANEVVVEPVAAMSDTDLPQGTTKHYQIEAGDTFADIMLRLGVSYEESMRIIESSKEVFDFTKVGAGKVLKLVFVNEAFAAMEYPLNRETVVHVKKENDGYEVAEKDIQYDVVETVAKGTISDSLFLAAKDAGVDDSVILRMADVFSWDVDFASDIQSGDTFSIVYEKRYLDGKPVGAGKLLAAQFTNNGTPYEAYRYNDKFYGSEGKSVARQFLKSPLNYTRISSSFAKSRVNPVTRNVLPHLAIDYAAPTGTPIVAPASGKIATAGRKGDLGIAIEIKHNNGYFTQYGHMSKIASGIKAGVSVKQGDIIGYVGSTGRSTGPHLHYTMTKNGTKVNPLQQDYAQEESLGGTELEAFKQIQSRLLEQIKEQ